MGIQKLKTLITLTALLSLSACASYSPIVDENEKYQEVGEQVAEQDIQRCTLRADRYLKKHKSQAMKKKVGRAAGAGAIVGGALGAFSGGGFLGNTAIGAGAGAAIGAGGAYVDEKMKGKFKPDALKQRYIAKCLQRKGYDVIGWK